jgi:hypothetical protein
MDPGKTVPASTGAGTSFFSPETEEAVPEIRSFRVESSLFSNIQHPLTECDGPSVSHQSTKIVPSGYLT